MEGVKLCRWFDITTKHKLFLKETIGPRRETCLKVKDEVLDSLMAGRRERWVWIEG